MKQITASLTSLSLFLFSFFTMAKTTFANGLGIGTIETPPGVDRYQDASGADIGIIYFISVLINIFAVVAGVWVVFNLTLAGYIYFTSAGDSGNHEKVRIQITNSLIGLALIVLSYTIGGLIGFIFFGDASFILSPSIPDFSQYAI